MDGMDCNLSQAVRVTYKVLVLKIARVKSGVFFRSQQFVDKY